MRRRAVDLDVFRAVTKSFAQRARIAHGELERPQYLDATLRGRETHAEIGTAQFARRAFQDEHQRSIWNHRMAVVEDRRIDLYLREQAVGITAQASHDLGKFPQGVDAHHRRPGIERPGFSGGSGLSILGHSALVSGWRG
jgi:hypothetical protein